TILSFLVVFTTAVFADTHTGHITSNTAWSGVDTIVGTVTVDDGVTLTIAPSSVIKFNVGTALRVYGVLIADGTITNKITFTANGSSVPGSWSYITFSNADPGCKMDNCLIQYGGGSCGNIRVYGSGNNVLIQNCDIVHSGSAGIFIGNYGADPILRNNIISNNLTYGIHNNSGNPLIEDNEFNNNGDYMIYTYAYNVENIIGSLTYSGNGHDEIFVHGHVFANNTWANHGVPYILGGANFEVTDGGTLTIEAGNTLKFDGNYQFEVQGTLIADGSTNQITFTSNEAIPTPGFWNRIYFVNADPGCLMDNCLIQYGGSSTANVYISGDGADVTIRNCDINYSGSSGIYIGNYGVNPILRNNDISDNVTYGIHNNSGNPLIEDHEFHNNGSYMIYTYAYNIQNITGTLTYSGNVHNEIFVHGMDFGDNTWANHGVPYILGGADFKVLDGNTLTIEPGNTLKFAGNYQFEVQGTLIADGSTDQITFTSNQATPTPGYWNRFYFVNADAGCLMDNCLIQYGGYYTANVYIYGDGSNVTIRNSEISYSGNSGIGVSANADPIIQNCTISDNLDYGISCHFSYSTPFISDCILENNGNYAMYVWAATVGRVTGSNTISGNNPNAIFVHGTDIGTQTWINHGAPYVPGGADFKVLDGNTLTIEPGNTLKFAGNYQFQVNGTLIAAGTVSDSITFTSNQASPAPGDWRYLYFANPDGACILDYCNISYGGSSSGNVRLYGNSGSVDFSNSTFSYSLHNGLHIQDYYTSSPVIDNCIFENNTEYGVWMQSASSQTFTGCIIQNNLDGVFNNVNSHNFTNHNEIINNTHNGFVIAGNADIQFGSDLTQWNDIYGNGVMNFSTNTADIYA
ncbi:MAG: right-handed parallel beta-helix repeat-containing protein, partial [Bacteroidales bacterium]|nr:right-handed parallel beta-helix repeat-containing protein [Bacteroidales bacterium]